MKKIALLILISLFSSCLGDKITEKMKSWVGHPESELVASWGAPTSVYRMDDGSKVITYSYSNDDASSYVDSYGVRHYSETSRSTRSFTINSRGIVTSWRWRGY